MSVIRGIFTHTVTFVVGCFVGFVGPFVISMLVAPITVAAQDSKISTTQAQAPAPATEVPTGSLLWRDPADHDLDWLLSVDENKTLLVILGDSIQNLNIFRTRHHNFGSDDIVWRDPADHDLDWLLSPKLKDEIRSDKDGLKSKVPQSLSDRIKSANLAAIQVDRRLLKTQERQKAQISTSQILTELVPLYSGEDYSTLYTEATDAGVKMVPHFGKTMVAAYADLESEDMPELKRLKTSKVSRLGSIFTKHVLDQETLHLPEYEGVIESFASKGEPRCAEVVEVIQSERINDERELESFANPSWGQFFSWWWNR
jgi:hypothetical protein